MQGPPTGEGFPKARRLLKRSDFVRVQGAGAGAGSRDFVVIVSPRPEPGGADMPSRLGVVASRKTGNAVQRNRGKRLVREWFRHTLQDHRGVDIVVILRRGAPDLHFTSACAELDNGLRRAIKKARRGVPPGTRAARPPAAPPAAPRRDDPRN